MLPKFLPLRIVAKITFSAQVFAVRADSPCTLDTSTSFIPRGVENTMPHIFRTFLTRYGKGVEQPNYGLRYDAQKSGVKSGNIRSAHKSGIRMNEWYRGVFQRKFLWWW